VEILLLAGGGLLLLAMASRGSSTQSGDGGLSPKVDLSERPFTIPTNPPVSGKSEAVAEASPGPTVQYTSPKPAEPSPYAVDQFYGQGSSPDGASPDETEYGSGKWDAVRTAEEADGLTEKQTLFGLQPLHPPPEQLQQAETSVLPLWGRTAYSNQIDYPEAASGGAPAETEPEMIDRYTHGIIAQPSDAAQYTTGADVAVVNTMEDQSAETYTDKLAGDTKTPLKR
jgi:hypothetical protein